MASWDVMCSQRAATLKRERNQSTLYHADNIGFVNTGGKYFPMRKRYLGKKCLARYKLLPTSKSALKFWTTVTIEKCQKYIGHMRKVIPEVIWCEGAATDY